MPEIPKDLADRIYSQYKITITSPVGFDEFFQIEKRKGAPDGIMIKDVTRHAYERAIVKPEGQLFWLHQLHVKTANLKEPYDVGFLNALTFCMNVFTGKEPEFAKKPGSQVNKDTNTRKNARKRHDALNKAHTEEIKALKDEIKALKAG